jgi:hypothetical protein
MVHMTPSTGVTLPLGHVDVDQCVRTQEGPTVVDASLLFVFIRQRSFVPAHSPGRGNSIYPIYQTYLIYLTTSF